MLKKYVRLMLVAMLLILVGCGSAPVTQTASPSETQVPPTATAPTQSVPSPVGTPPATQGGAPTETATTGPTEAPTATASPTSVPTMPAGEGTNLPPGWSSVAWEGFNVAVPLTYTHEVEDLQGQSVFAGPGAPMRSRLILIPPGQPNEAPARMMLEAAAWTGTLNDYLDAVRQAGSERPVIDENSVQRVLVAGFPGMMYARDASESFRYYVVLRPGTLLLISLDMSDPVQFEVIGALTSSATGSEPTVIATASPNAGETTGEVAYVQDDRIWLLDLASEQARMLTELEAVQDMAWSPDGQRLAVTSGTESSDIYLVDADGKNMERITESEAHDAFPQFAPDGTLVWVRHQRQIDPPVIEVVQRVGETETVAHAEPGGLCGATNLHLGTDQRFALALNCGRGSHVLLGALGSQEVESLAETYLQPVTGCAYDADWAGDQMIVVTSEECLPAQNTTIMAIHLADKSVTPRFSSAGIGTIDVAPDAQKLVFAMVDPMGQGAGIWLLDLESAGQPHQISSVGTRPAWRPHSN